MAFLLPDPINLVADAVTFLGVPALLAGTWKLWSEIRKDRAERNELFGISPEIAHDLKNWPGLTRGDATKLLVERGHYLSTLNSEATANLADEYAPILREALEDHNYGNYRLIARSLPAIVQGFANEQPNRSWRGESGSLQDLDPHKLVEKLSALNAPERIGILDCAVAERQRRAAPAREIEPK